MRRFARRLLLALALAGAGECSDSSGPVAGPLTVSLATPNPGADGAILLTVAGPQVPTSIVAAPGLRVFSQGLSTTTRVAVTGALANGALLTITVPDIRRSSQYVATVEAVAATDYRLRGLAGYTATVAR